MTINTVTLNPAVDKVLFLSRFEKNNTNRIKNMRETIGGKGTHVSINLKLLGVTSRAFGICHGENGGKIINELRSHELDVSFLHHPGAESRTNYLVVEDNGDSTLLAERGTILAAWELDELAGLMSREIQEGDYLVLSGDTSNCDPDIYSRILSRLSEKRLKVFLDTSGKTLADCVTKSPFLIKPNLDELSFLCERPVSTDVGDVVDAIASLERYRIDVVAVSMGARGAVVRTENGIYQASPPEINVVNTIGCGDCFLAGLLYGFFCGFGIEDGLRLATSAAAATAESPISVGFETARAKELAARVKITKIS